MRRRLGNNATGSAAFSPTMSSSGFPILFGLDELNALADVQNASRSLFSPLLDCPRGRHNGSMSIQDYP